MKYYYILIIFFLLIVGIGLAEENIGYTNQQTTIVTSCIHNSQLINSSSAKITIYDSLGNIIINNQIMNSNGAGKFSYDYNFTISGWYSTKETCDFGNKLADGSSKILIIDEPTTVKNTNGTLTTILNGVEQIHNQATNISYQTAQAQNTLNNIVGSLSGINNTVNNISISGGSENLTNLSNEITGAIITEINKPPFLDFTSIIIIIMLVLMFLTIWVKTTQYFIVVGFALISGAVYLCVEVNIFIGLVFGCIGLIYFIGAGLKTRD